MTTRARVSAPIGLSGSLSARDAQARLAEIATSGGWPDPAPWRIVLALLINNRWLLTTGGNDGGHQPEEKTMHITLAQASGIVDAALAHARKGAFNPMAAAVIDAGGHLVAFKREDRSGILRFQIAREIAGRAMGNPSFIRALTAISGGRLVPASGGVLIVSDGEMIGAVGISGDTSDCGEICALEGMEAVGFETKPGVTRLQSSLTTQQEVPQCLMTMSSSSTT
jgi:uncharacterized protein GlcG (DUF336 family)